MVFHYVLGVAMMNWSSVENQIRRVMIAGFKHEAWNHEALNVGYFSLDGFRSRLLLADSVISRKLASINPKEHATWKRLSVKARELSQSRNKLAHWSVGQYWHRNSGLRVVLMPWVGPKKKKKTKNPMPPDGALSIREIYRLSMQFIAFAVVLENFLHRLVGQPEPLAKSAEQAGNPPTGDNLARQIREVFATRPQPSLAKS